ncbi:hypothetical protein G6F57_012149 [Rhizopus arrhizus]|nr:hypothetical protein G6F57_012149 [Rhizopus arrhizus]
MKAFFPRALLLAAFTLPFCQDALAGVVVNGTRVIYPAQAREVTVQVDNVGDSPALVQAWIDSGDANQTADTSDAPFVLTPPIARVEPGRSQALRVIFSGAQLPADRESVFWLNVLDVPPSPDNADNTGEQNYLQVAFRSRLKLFYRPQGLKGVANDAPAALRWTRTGDRLRVENPSPFHVTLAEVHAMTGSSEKAVEDKGAMVAPKQSLEFAAPAGTDQAICLLAAGVACPGWALAAPANLGEQALMAQSGAANARAPESAQFNSSFLSGQAKQVDLAAFSNGNPMVAGTYRVDVYVNGGWQGRRDLQFKADAQGHVDACLPLPLLEEMGVDSEAVLLQQDPTLPTDKTSCVPVQQRMANAYGIYDSGNLRYDLSIPQVFLRREARGYVNPALWDRGINAGFVGYSFNAIDSDSRVEGGQRNRSAYLGLNAGLNLGGWQFRHDSNLTWSEGDGRHWQSIATYAQRGIPQVRGMLTIGEAYTTGELFDSIGYRGASLASDDRMLPDSLRGYAPVVRGIAETNARVEVRQNQQLIYSSTVSPGSFVIDDLYPTGYGGDLEVSVIEADGRRREFKVPFGSVPQMLREGVSRYALTAGQVRNKLLADEPWLVQGTYQRGIGNQLTLYGGSALSDGYLSLLYGVGLSTPVGAFAADVTHARTSFDHYGNHTGASVRLSYSNMIGETGTTLTLAAYRYSTEGFYSLQDALYGRDSDKRGIDPTTRGRQRSQFQLTLNQPLGRRGGALYVTGSVRDFYDRAGTSKQYQVGYNNAWRSVNFVPAVDERAAGPWHPPGVVQCRPRHA